MVGGILLLSAGLGGLVHGKLLALAGGSKQLLFWLSLLIPFLFGVGAVACYLEQFWLMMLGFAIPTGLVFANVFMASVIYLLRWGSVAGRVGFSTGVYGIYFGVWGAFYSIIAPLILDSLGLIWLLGLTGFCLAGTQLLNLRFVIDPPPLSKPAKTPHASVAKPPQLTPRDVVRIPTFWIVALFFFLFLTPGFGIKIVVTAFTGQVFQVSQSTSAIIAAAFLISYGVSRLGFGILSDKLRVKPMYLMFSAIQVITLLATAIMLPFFDGVLMFAVLMCITGAMFAAGKYLWRVVMVRIYGAENFHVPMAMTEPFYGIAGFVGPLTLTWALRATDVVSAASYWFYAASAVLAVCAVLFHLLRRVNYDKFVAHENQGVQWT